MMEVWYMSINKDSSGKLKYKQITIDMDTRELNILLKCLKTLKRYGFTEDLYIGLSPSGKGYHIISWHKTGVSKEKMMKIRKKAGDDKIRIMLDNRTGRQSDVLFSRKIKKKVIINE